MADPVVAELNEHFGTGGKELEPDVVAELQSIMRLHQLSPQDLFYKFEAYSIPMNLDKANISMDILRAFKQNLLDALERNSRAQAHIKSERRIGATPRNVVKGGDIYGMLDSLSPSTPGVGKLNKAPSAKKRQVTTPSISRVKGQHAGSSPDQKTPPTLEDQLNSLGAIPPSSFNDRPNPGEPVEIFNQHLQAPETPIAPFGESRIKLAASSDQSKLAYKTMATKLSEASGILDDRISEFTRYLTEDNVIDESELGNAANQSTTDMVAVGRIASDSAEGKLNAASLVLETSRSMGNGWRVPLNLDQLKGGYQFFPGQIVALRGSNASGHEFLIKEVLSIPRLPNAASTAADLEAHRERLRGGPDAMDSDSEPPPLNVIFASGPYTADDNLDFEPLYALCDQAANTYADALVLTGPFIDMNHPLIATGDFDLPEGAAVDPDTVTMSTVFKYMFSPALNALVASNPHVTILLVPSIRDAIDKHVTWPQDAFPRKELGLPKTTRLIGNPMTLRINEMVLGISSQDILFQLQHEELVGGRPSDPSLFSRLSRYLVEQRHYFPLFPPTDRRKLPKVGVPDGIPAGSSLDVSYLQLGDMEKVRPDVLVVPSSLTPFVKVVESVLVINPGYLSKRRGAGTYARMTLRAPSSEAGTAGGMVAHQVFERARVEITRI